MSDHSPFDDDVTRSMPPVPPPPPSPAPPAPAPASQPVIDRDSTLPVWAVLAVVSVAALLIGLFVSEDGAKLWDGGEAWSVFAIVCALLQLVPWARRSTKLSEPQAWQLAAIGAGGLALYWLLIVLPVIGRNTSFAVTLAVAAAAGVVWLAPGRHR